MRREAVLALAFLVCFLVWLPKAGHAGVHLKHGKVILGQVLSAEEPVAGAEVSLYAAGAGGKPRLIGRTCTTRDGRYLLYFRPVQAGERVLYLTARGGALAYTHKKLSRYFKLATALGPPPWPDTVALNELTTVASAFSLAQFLDNSRVSGTAPGLPIASLMTRHLVDIETGGPGATLTNDANGNASLTPNTLNELANLLATCARDHETCVGILKNARTLRGKLPADTFQAMANVAANPWRDPVPLFDLVAEHPYQPDLGGTPPAAWVLALKFQGDPRPFAGPANIAVDKDGQLWVGNNYVHEEGFILPDCAGDLLYKLDPTTGLVDTYTGGGVDGVGYGITIDPNSDIWVGNFGFKGSTCPINPASDSVSQFAPNGTALSPDAQIINGLYPQGGGWTNGSIGWPQGTVSNIHGDIWIASCNGGMEGGEQVDLTIYHGGDHNDFTTISEPDLVKPFDIAFDIYGIAWVSGTNSDNLFAFLPDGTQIPGSPFYLGAGSRPMGVATDSRGNVWVSLSGRLELPCPDLVNPVPASGRPLAAMFNYKGFQAVSRSVSGVNATVPGGMTIAWGMAVDGLDNVWVSNFGLSGLSSFCGANPAGCPSGYKPGDALSPDNTGYPSALLDRDTAVQVDSSGNVWVVNNWKDVPIQTDPAGDGLVVFLGLAAPVKTPIVAAQAEQAWLPRHLWGWRNWSWRR